MMDTGWGGRDTSPTVTRGKWRYMGLQSVFTWERELGLPGFRDQYSSRERFHSVGCDELGISASSYDFYDMVVSDLRAHN